MKSLLIYFAGIVTGAVGLFFSGFFSSAGDDLWKYVKNKIHPPEPEPIIVSELFVPPDLNDRQKIRWAQDFRVAELKAKGYEYYLGESGRKYKRCMRPISGNYSEEFLMVKKLDKFNNG